MKGDIQIMNTHEHLCRHIMVFVYTHNILQFGQGRDNTITAMATELT